MTRKRKTRKAKKTKNMTWVADLFDQGTTAKSERVSESVDELYQLRMFQEGEFEADQQDERPDEPDGSSHDHQADQFEEGDEAGEVDFAAMEEVVQEAEHVLDSDHVLEADHEHESQGPRVRRREQTHSSDFGRGPNLLLYAGWLMLVPAACLLMASLFASARVEFLLEHLRTAGLTPTALVTLSVIVIGVAILRGRQANIELRVGEVEATLLDNDTGMSASLDYLVEAQEQHMDRPPASGEELERVLHVLHRQDEKVNNLTRAMKMYGKPLIEITKQIGDVTTTLDTLRSSLGALNEGVDVNSMETVLATTSETLRQHISEELDKIRSAVSKQDHDNDAMTGALDDLKRELSNLASSIQKLQQPGVASRPVTPAASVPAAPSMPNLPGGIGPSPRDAGFSGLAQSISGTKTSSGKDVLGSIAKLKKMRE